MAVRAQCSTHRAAQAVVQWVGGRRGLAGLASRRGVVALQVRGDGQWGGHVLVLQQLLVGACHALHVPKGRRLCAAQQHAKSPQRLSQEDTCSDHCLMLRCASKHPRQTNNSPSMRNDMPYTACLVHSCSTGNSSIHMAA